MEAGIPTDNLKEGFMLLSVLEKGGRDKERERKREREKEREIKRDGEKKM